MEKFSVKKPFTVLVGVVMVLLLGFVALSHMQTNRRRAKRRRRRR